MDCVKCGAPLPPKSNICNYCGTLNETDLRALPGSEKEGAANERLCPHCGVNLRSVELKLEGRFVIERCDRCFGLFFDPHELESLIDVSVSNVHGIDYERMAVLIEEERNIDPPSFKYVECPVCHKLMNRRAYGSRSGVVIDTCKNHGVWLDGGELSQLLKWAKAGGQLHDKDQKAEEARRRERRERIKRETKPAASYEHTWEPGAGLDSDSDYLVGALGLILRLLR